MPEHTYHESLQPIVGGRVAALVVGGIVGPGAGQSLLSWADLTQTRGVEILPLLHALELEEKYLEQVLDFDQPLPPRYRGGVDLVGLRDVFDVDRLIFLLALREDGEVFAKRDYVEVEMTQLQALLEQLGAISESVVKHGMESRRRRRAN